MRVVNDKDEKVGNEINFINMLSNAAFCAFGVATAIFSPLSMISAHIKQVEPWSKISCLIGAIFAVTLLEIPVPLVLVSFVLGIVVSDAVEKEVSLPKIISLGVGAGLFAAIVSLFIFSQLSQLSILSFWQSVIDQFLEQFSQVFNWHSAEELLRLKNSLLVEGPFYFVSFSMISTWVSIGLASHLQWFEKKNHPLNAKKLRQFVLPFWMSIVFIVIFALNFIVPRQYFHYTNGVFRVLATLFFMQGCIVLSGFFAQRELAPRMRSVLYTAFILLGFYALVGMGVIFPFINKRSKK